MVTVGTDTGSALRFESERMTVPAGTEVELTFENRATVPHDLVIGEPLTVSTSTVVAPGASETVSFASPAAGEHDFVCTLHPGMAGALEVDDQ